ncbi:hypothetical protein HOLleu_30014 [Holothuria leucospilota]|uniref:CCHC-type domain-containing protein n=1 Tax=Holothuria leucospilota TaxID=206669 RepID=A0A9Q1BK14_HOLLE|nr:hypothetical protein HOLleu_30014 [Holothuria leucospilota]
MMEQPEKEGSTGEEVAVTSRPDRQRTLTEKGFQWQLEQKEQRFRSLVSKWRRHAAKIECLLSESASVGEVKADRDTLLVLMTEVSKAYDELDSLLGTVNKTGSRYSVFENIESEHCTLVKRVSEYVRVEGSIFAKSASLKSFKSVSVKEELSAKIAAHDAKLKQIQLKAKYEVEQLELKAKYETELEKSELDIAKAKLEAIEGQSIHTKIDLPDEQLEYCKDYVETLGDLKVGTDPKSTNLDQDGDCQKQPELTNTAQKPGGTSGEVPKVQVVGDALNQPATAISSLENLSKDLSHQISLNRLPIPEPEVFSGDPLKYPGWKSAIDLLLEKKGISPSEKLFYLKRYISGPPKDALEGYFLVPTATTYSEARKLLDKRYGNNLVIADAFRSKLEQWPNIQPNDGIGLRKFADFLMQCESAMHLVKGSLSFLDDSWENRKLLNKLPNWLVTRWGRFLSDWGESKGSPPFTQFRQFICKEAEIACNPLITSSKAKRTGTTKGTSNFFTNAVGHSTKDSKIKCLLCKGEHKLDVCKQFRKDFVKSQNLCFGCLRHGHISKFCRNRLTCNVCSRLHPMSLHGDVSQSDRVKNSNRKTIGIQTEPLSTSVSNMSGSVTMTMSSLIMPVYISHKDLPHREVMVYALLDTQSDNTFLTDKLCEFLGVEGSKTVLNLSTLSAKNRLIDSRRVNGLYVRGCSEDTKIPLPVVYTQHCIPANRSHIPTPEMALQWPHLEQIAGSLMPVQQCEVGLLIGYNCPRALMPQEVISPQNDGPYAQRTELGWGIVGIVNPRELPLNNCDSVGISHFIVAPGFSVYDSNMQYPRAQVCFKINVKEVTPAQVAELMELEFNERNLDRAYSYEDQRFMNILMQGVRQLSDGHYQLPLPIKSLKGFPNNKPLALHRLNLLKRKLEGNDVYAKDYIAFMQGTIDKGYAELVPSSEPKCNCVNYIPHHGVYHPKKGKIRVVFDCSARFKGVSLNDHLLTGPNLTNNLIGVLCRFRQERVAFAGDIEFYQFKVNPEHRDLLRFLWWQEGNFTCEPIEYRMTVHLFGAGSSPGCANYGLKQIALDHGSEFGEDVVEFVNKNFYVDDGLYSVDTDDKAVDLILRTKQMLSKGGVNFHKFKSNSKVVLSSLPECDVEMSAGVLNPFSESVDVDRVLGIQWCVESDKFKFRIVINDTPLTRRGVLSTISSVYDPFGFIAPVILVGKQILQQLCHNNLDWDSPLPDQLRCKWVNWRSSLPRLESIEIERCFKPLGFGTSVKTELHHFCDASVSGYGYCSYIRMINDDNVVHCRLVMSKSRVVPRKPVTVPRLELTAAVLSAKMSTLLKQELEYSFIEEYFWSDSQVVLSYINNDIKRFHVFVANRVQQIREVS